LLDLGGRSTIQVIPERALGVVADIDDPVFVPFAPADEDSSLG
jgi:hypothetical protein